MPAAWSDEGPAMEQSRAIAQADPRRVASNSTRTLRQTSAVKRCLNCQSSASTTPRPGPAGRISVTDSSRGGGLREGGRGQAGEDGVVDEDDVSPVARPGGPVVDLERPELIVSLDDDEVRIASIGHEGCDLSDPVRGRPDRPGQVIPVLDHDDVAGERSHPLEDREVAPLRVHLQDANPGRDEPLLQQRGQRPTPDRELPDPPEGRRLLNRDQRVERVAVPFGLVLDDVQGDVFVARADRDVEIRTVDRSAKAARKAATFSGTARMRTRPPPRLRGARARRCPVSPRRR